MPGLKSNIKLPVQASMSPYKLKVLDVIPLHSHLQPAEFETNKQNQPHERQGH